MELTKRNFSEKSVEVLDQVARLVFVTQNVVALGPTIIKTGDFSVAEAEVTKVAAYAEKVSSALLITLFHTNRRQRQAFKAAYKKAEEGYAEAYASALQLDVFEKTATGGQGKGIAGGVIAHLQYLKQYWDSLKAAQNKMTAP